MFHYFFNLLSVVILGLSVSHEVQPSNRLQTEFSKDHIQVWSYGSDNSDTDDMPTTADQYQNRSDSSDGGHQIITDEDKDGMYADP